MINDLISREYVKLFVCEYEKFNGKETEIVKAVPIIAIDNAPTVETYTKDEYEGAYLRGYVDSAKANERPKGEWIKNKTRPNKCQCTECGNYDLSYFPYCHWCGAEMRGKEE